MTYGNSEIDLQYKDVLFNIVTKFVIVVKLVVLAQALTKYI